MGKSKKPKPPPVLPEAPLLPDPAAKIGGNDKKKRRRSAGGTVLTSGRGATGNPQLGTKTLLGQ